MRIWCRLVLLNAPSFFSLLWRICEPIMPGSTRNKVKVVRSHQVSFTKRLRLIFRSCALCSWCIDIWHILSKLVGCGQAVSPGMTGKSVVV